MAGLLLFWVMTKLRDSSLIVFVVPGEMWSQNGVWTLGLLDAVFESQIVQVGGAGVSSYSIPRSVCPYIELINQIIAVSIQQ